MKPGKIRDTSRHWTGGCAIRSWDVDCACCGKVRFGEGAKSRAWIQLRADGWSYFNKRVPIEDGVFVRFIRGWLCGTCISKRVVNDEEVTA